mgnify:CR=1 FL=1
MLSLYCENNNNITLPKLFLSAAGVLVICLIAYDGKLHKKIAISKVFVLKILTGQKRNFVSFSQKQNNQWNSRLYRMLVGL